MDYRYEENEVSYQRLKRMVESAVDYAGRSFENFDLRPFLEAMLPLMTFSGERPRAFRGMFSAGSGIRRDRFDPSTGIVYRRLPADSGAYESAVRDGAEWSVPWLRLVLSPGLLRDELERAGFRVTHQDGACCLCVLADRPAGGLPCPADCGGAVFP
jgi:hypothetical protein